MEMVGAQVIMKYSFQGNLNKRFEVSDSVSDSPKEQCFYFTLKFFQHLFSCHQV